MAREEDRIDAELSVVRRAYAKQILFASGAEDPRLERALAKVPREAFLGPGPWPIQQMNGEYRMTPDSDPVYLYQDEPIGMISEKGLNNGTPSFLTLLISFGRLREGEKVLHIGAGRGYYTAIIAEMVGPTGRVTAVEYEQDLAIRAAENLAGFRQVEVVHGDGCTIPLAPCDVIYVNAGVTRPANSWLDAMKDGGRLILPLTVNLRGSYGDMMSKGAIFLIERAGEKYLATRKSDTIIYPCVGARDEASEAALASAFEKGSREKVTRLYRTEEIEAERCWVRGPDWSLAYS